MNTVPENKDTPETAQRDALNESEKQAAEPQPGSYKERESGEKTVGVLPIDADSMPMEGLDPNR